MPPESTGRGRPAGGIVAPSESERYHEASRCLDLWMEVLTRAMLDYSGLARHLRHVPAASHTPALRAEWRALREWFASDALDTGSFVWICHMLDIAPSRIRRQLETKLGIPLAAPPQSCTR